MKSVSKQPLPEIGGQFSVSQALDCRAPLAMTCSGLTFTTDGADSWRVDYFEDYQGLCSAQSGDIEDEHDSYLQTEVTGSGTIKFWWKVSSEEGCDNLEFWIDSTRQDWISGSVGWEQKSYGVSGTGTHTLKWRYVKDGSVSTGDDCGWVDWVQWSGSSIPVPEPAANNWTTLLYRYDAAGRRIEKQYNYETITKYVYDGDHCIAEYNAYNQLRRKYIYGPCTDEPISMIEAAGSYAGTYYYHFDALGSVVALTSGNAGSMGNTVEVYEYDVYGRLGASDASHPNRILFTGREYDKETGLYYYRARYYNPQIGRFLQTDPVGYKAGMNLYTYCKNDPVGLGDPYGLEEADPWGGLNNAPEGTWFEFSKATGRVLILPKNLDPGKLQMCNDFASFIGRWRNVVKRIPGAPKIPKKVADYYLQGLEDVTKALPGIAGLDKSAWRAFIEVSTYDATKGKNGWTVRTICENDWVEVVCLGGWAEELGGYESYGAAVQAAQTGIKWFNDTHRGIGVAPTPPASIFYDNMRDNMFWGHWRYTGRAPSMGDYLSSIGE